MSQVSGLFPGAFLPQGRKGTKEVGCTGWLHTVMEQRASITCDRNVSFTAVLRCVAGTAGQWSAGQWSQGEHSRSVINFQFPGRDAYP